jgi:four helix bundle protein
LVSQINRCSISVSSNIAEGAGRNTNGEFKNQLGTAAGSIFEMETQLLISKNLNYITKEKFDDLMVKVEKIKKMLYKLINSLKIILLYT